MFLSVSITDFFFSVVILGILLPLFLECFSFALSFQAVYSLKLTVQVLAVAVSSKELALLVGLLEGICCFTSMPNSVLHSLQIVKMAICVTICSRTLNTCCEPLG